MRRLRQQSSESLDIDGLLSEESERQGVTLDTLMNHYRKGMRWAYLMLAGARVG